MKNDVQLRIWHCVFYQTKQDGKEVKLSELMLQLFWPK
jgi:hypothetical protein